MLYAVLQEIGADETVNYREQDFAEVYKDKPFDYIFDSVGGEHKETLTVCMPHRTSGHAYRVRADFDVFIAMHDEISM